MNSVLEITSIIIMLGLLIKIILESFVNVSVLHDQPKTKNITIACLDFMKIIIKNNTIYRNIKAVGYHSVWFTIWNILRFGNVPFKLIQWFLIIIAFGSKYLNSLNFAIIEISAQILTYTSPMLLEIMDIISERHMSILEWDECTLERWKKKRKCLEMNKIYKIPWHPRTWLMSNEIGMGSEYIGELRMKNYFTNIGYFGKARNLVRNFIGILILSQVTSGNLIQKEINTYNHHFTQTKINYFAIGGFTTSCKRNYNNNFIPLARKNIKNIDKRLELFTVNANVINWESYLSELDKLNENKKVET